MSPLKHISVYGYCYIVVVLCIPYNYIFVVNKAIEAEKR